jgi:hypothetical protein
MAGGVIAASLPHFARNSRRASRFRSASSTVFVMDGALVVSDRKTMSAAKGSG